MQLISNFLHESAHIVKNTEGKKNTTKTVTNKTEALYYLFFTLVIMTRASAKVRSEIPSLHLLSL